MGETKRVLILAWTRTLERSITWSRWYMVRDWTLGLSHPVLFVNRYQKPWPMESSRLPQIWSEQGWRSRRTPGPAGCLCSTCRATAYGSLPASIGNFSSLQTLLLGSNQLVAWAATLLDLATGRAAEAGSSEQQQPDDPWSFKAWQCWIPDLSVQTCLVRASPTTLPKTDPLLLCLGSHLSWDYPFFVVVSSNTI